VGKYQKPKKNLHREFFYLNHDTILNSLSAFEAGQIDEILEKTTEASEGSVDGGVGFKGTRIGGVKKKQGSIHEELVKTRTRFSSFESWFSRLAEEGALGTFDEWDMEVRDEVAVGDTLHFSADVRVSPLFKMITAYSSFTQTPQTFGLKQQGLAEAKRISR
jgi:hypothetical protein